MIFYDLAHNDQEGNHGPFSHCDVYWGSDRRSGFNASIGMALPSQESQRSNGHRLRRHTGKSPVNLTASVHTSRRWDRLHNRMVPAVLAPPRISILSSSRSPILALSAKSYSRPANWHTQMAIASELCLAPPIAKNAA
jgi:hypothetical protein